MVVRAPFVAPISTPCSFEADPVIEVHEDNDTSVVSGHARIGAKSPDVPKNEDDDVLERRVRCRCVPVRLAGAVQSPGRITAPRGGADAGRLQGV